MALYSASGAPDAERARLARLAAGAVVTLRPFFAAAFRVAVFLPDEVFPRAAVFFPATVFRPVLRLGAVFPVVRVVAMPLELCQEHALGAGRSVSSDPSSARATALPGWQGRDAGDEAGTTRGESV